VSDTAEQAAQFIMAIKDELEENELLVETYGNKQGNSIWAQSKIITRDKIQVVGKVLVRSYVVSSIVSSVQTRSLWTIWKTMKT
jgi:hypothetical protein